MNEELFNLQYSPIRDINYESFFEEVSYNGNTLSDLERKAFIAIVDDKIRSLSEGLPLIYDVLQQYKNRQDDYSKTYYTVASTLLFVTLTQIDGMVAGKYFILADGDYDKRYMRGKMKVILNEGFKCLYGFDKKTNKKPEWDNLQPLLNHFPEVINRQYQELTFHLEKYAKSSSWWKEERDVETHLDAERLYESRQEEVIESKVMMESLKLLNTLAAVHIFLVNMHSCLRNYQVTKYRNGELIQN